MVLGATVFELLILLQKDFKIIISTTLHLYYTTDPNVNTGGLGGGPIAAIVIVLLLVIALCVAVVIVLGIIWRRKQSGEEERFYGILLQYSHQISHNIILQYALYCIATLRKESVMAVVLTFVLSGQTKKPGSSCF